MQEMIELSKAQQEQPDHPPKAVIFAVHAPSSGDVSNASSSGSDVIVKTLAAGPAQFGTQLKGDVMVRWS